MDQKNITENVVARYRKLQVWSFLSDDIDKARMNSQQLCFKRKKKMKKKRVVGLILSMQQSKSDGQAITKPQVTSKYVADGRNVFVITKHTQNLLHAIST